MIGSKQQEFLDAAMEVIAQDGWHDFSLLDVAERTGCDLAQVQSVFSCKDDVLSTLGQVLDQRVAESIAPLREDETCRDRLFDIVMERYEALNEYRGAVQALFHEICAQPKLILTGLPHLSRSMDAMLSLAGIETNGVRGAARLLGFTALYLRGVERLVKDDSPDITKVMAGLDRDLQHLERAANFISI